MLKVLPYAIEIVWIFKSTLWKAFVALTTILGIIVYSQTGGGDWLFWPLIISVIHWFTKSELKEE